jgi:hypothetical protein
MKKTQREIDLLTEDIIDILCQIQEEEIKNVLEKAHEIRFKQSCLSCDEDSEDSEEDHNNGSGTESDSDDNSFFETDSDSD